MIPTKKIKKLIHSTKKILNNHIETEILENEISTNLISEYLIISEYIETRKWLQNLQESIKSDLKREFWDICIHNVNINYDFKSLNTLNAELSNELKNTVIEIFAIDQTYSSKYPLLNDPILIDIQSLSNLIQYYHFITNDKEEDNSRKASGSYYTPPGVISYILKRLKSDILMNTDSSDNIRILDYSCGMGAFLIYAAAFVSLQNFKNIKFSYWGFDNDHYVIEICKYMLKLLKFHPNFGNMFQSISFLHTDSLESLKANQWENFYQNLLKTI